MQELVQLRPLKPEDGPQIAVLSEKAQIGKLDLPAWEKMLWGYPLEQEFAGFAAGWVLESAAGSVVGYLGNIHQMFRYNGEPVRAGIASSWMVDPSWRGNSMQLLFAFYKQPGMQILINGSANATTMQILTAMKMPRIPAPQYDEPCFWPLRHVNFAGAVLRRKAVQAAPALAYPAGAYLWLRGKLQSRMPRSSPLAVHAAQAFDSRFDEFWLKLSAPGSRLRAVRTAEVLQWRYGASLASGQCVVLTAGSDKLPAGYVVLQTRSTDMEGLKLMELADIQAIGDDPNTLLALWKGAYDYARSQGADALKWMTGTPPKRAVANALAPLTYQLPLWQLYYKQDRNFTVDLAGETVWDFSLFDTY